MNSLNINSSNICYLVLNSTADCQPVKEYFAQAVWNDCCIDAVEAMPLWNGTEYSEWLVVAPYLARIRSDHAFIEWLNQQDDWGFIVESQYDFKTVYAHLQSLTQIWLANGRHAFFKFWQPSVSFKVFDLLPTQSLHELMGPCTVFRMNQQIFVNPIQAQSVLLREFPWWAVPEVVSNILFTETPDIFVTNMMTWIKDNRGDLLEKFGDKILQAKLKAYHILNIQRSQKPAVDVASVLAFIER